MNVILVSIISRAYKRFTSKKKTKPCEFGKIVAFGISKNLKFFIAAHENKQLQKSMDLADSVRWNL